MKICRKCKLEKEDDEFSFTNAQHVARRPSCKACTGQKLDKSGNIVKRDKLYYQRNREKVIERTSKYNKAHPEIATKAVRKFRRKKYQEFLELKGKCKCVKCGEDDISCLDFHHIDPITKVDSISNIYHSTNKFKEELKKCVVLCANCHRKLHAQGTEHFLTFVAASEGLDNTFEADTQ